MGPVAYIWISSDEESGQRGRQCRGAETADPATDARLQQRETGVGPDFRDLQAVLRLRPLQAGTEAGSDRRKFGVLDKRKNLFQCGLRKRARRRVHVNSKEFQAAVPGGRLLSALGGGGSQIEREPRPSLYRFHRQERAGGLVSHLQGHL